MKPLFLGPRQTHTCEDTKLLRTMCVVEGSYGIVRVKALTSTHVCVCVSAVGVSLCAMCVCVSCRVVSPRVVSCRVMSCRVMV